MKGLVRSSIGSNFILIVGGVPAFYNIAVIIKAYVITNKSLRCIVFLTVTSPAQQFKVTKAQGNVRKVYIKWCQLFFVVNCIRVRRAATFTDSTPIDDIRISTLFPRLRVIKLLSKFPSHYITSPSLLIIRLNIQSLTTSHAPAEQAR